MTAHFIFLGLCVIFLFLGTFFLGKDIERNKIIKDTKDIDNRDVKKILSCRKTLYGGISFWFFFGFLYFCILFIFTHNDVKEYYINGYRNGEIVENITYKYDNINGEKVLKDSTITYHIYKP